MLRVEVPFAPGTFLVHRRQLGNYPETGFREIGTGTDSVTWTHKAPDAN